MKLTSAAANKLIKKLEAEKDFYLKNEQNSRYYVAAVDETPVIPDYDFTRNSDEIDLIDQKTLKLKHAVNLSNATAQIDVGGKILSVDQILVRMAQLNRRLTELDEMRKQLPKSRVESMGLRGSKPEYTYLNYDLDEVKARYETVSDEITRLQLALDRHNQTFEFEVEDI